MSAEHVRVMTELSRVTFEFKMTVFFFSDAKGRAQTEGV
jgi:SpoU rRNA methylase family enzyme